MDRVDWVCRNQYSEIIEVESKLLENIKKNTKQSSDKECSADCKGACRRRPNPETADSRDQRHNCIVNRRADTARLAATKERVEEIPQMRILIYLLLYIPSGKPNLQFLRERTPQISSPNGGTAFILSNSSSTVGQ